MATRTTIKSTVTAAKPAAPAAAPRTSGPRSSAPRSGGRSNVKTQSSTGRSSQAAATNAPRAKKTCLFCDNKNEPTFTDSATLKKFMNDRAKISAHTRSGLCSKHQRRVAREIKHARHLAMLPFVASL